MLDRTLAIPLHRAARLGGPVLVQGPRASGKTTLLRREFPGHTYIAFEEPASRTAARRDPLQFLARLRGRPSILDDLHRTPELIAWLAAQPFGELLLASSQRLTLPCPVFELHPPTGAELERRPALPLEMLGRFEPKRFLSSPAPATAWPNGRRRFLEADLPSLIQVHDRDRFESFLDRVEEASGGVLDQQALARQAGIAHRTAVRWLAVLETCFLTLRLPSAGFDHGRRIVRAAKLHWLGSARFESRCVSQIYRNACHAGERPDLRYWRDSNGLEISLVVQVPELPPVPALIEPEPGPSTYARLRRWMALAGVSQGAIIAKRAAPNRGGILTYFANDL